MEIILPVALLKKVEEISWRKPTSIAAGVSQVLKYRYLCELFTMKCAGWTLQGHGGDGQTLTSGLTPAR